MKILICHLVSAFIRRLFFFDDYDIDKDIDLHLLINRDKEFLYNDQVKKSSLDNKILFLVSLETRQNRYRTQVDTPFVPHNECIQLVERLGSLFRKDENVQVICSIDFSDDKTGKPIFSARGFADVVKDETVYELKFVSELTHEHFLQCASYIVALNLKKGILWNTRNNSMYEITVPNKIEFLNAVTRTVTKNYIKKYIDKKQEVIKDMHRIAIIDTETNWDDKVMSIGAVIADSETYEPIVCKYFILKQESLIGGMYSNVLYINKKYEPIICDRCEAISLLKDLLNEQGVQSIFAYNANFDFRHLPELAIYSWYDIMRLAAYKQYNFKIPQNAECCSTGRLKNNYGVEAILRMLTGNNEYKETHNAILDALDELKTMKILGREIEEYNCAVINRGTISFDSKIKLDGIVKNKEMNENITSCANTDDSDIKTDGIVINEEQVENAISYANTESFQTPQKEAEVKKKSFCERLFKRNR